MKRRSGMKVRDEEKECDEGESRAGNSLISILRESLVFCEKMFE